MQTRSRLGLYIQKLLEAGWLLALICVPLYFNVYSNRVFEPDKLAILRTIAVLAGAGILTLGIERWSSEREGIATFQSNLRQAWSFPLVRSAVFLLGAFILATLFSVTPRISLWGSYQRLQGTFTLICYLILFAALLLSMRTKSQLERLLSTVIFTSVPIALYGLVQHAGIDPMPWSGNVIQRIASTMGNAIFVGAYLIMVIPPTIARLIQVLGSLQEGLPRRERFLVVGAAIWAFAIMVFAWLRMDFHLALLISLSASALLTLLTVLLGKPTTQGALLGCYLSILGAQGMALLYSGSRGPQVGLVGGLAIWALLVAATRKRRLALGAALAGSVLLVSFLVIFNLPQSPLASLRQVPYIGRLGQLLELEKGTGKVRTLIWQGAVEMIRSDPLRAIVGYGPESMYVSYNRFYLAELAHYERRNASPDRSHNETFDMLITTGVIGLAASLAVFIGIFYHAYTWLGLLTGRRARQTFFLCVGAGGALGVLLPRMLEGTWRLAGVGLPFGIIAGLAAYIVLQVFWGHTTSPQCESWAMALIIGLLAAITAHWIEISVGIAIASTRTYFWVYTALLLLLGQGLIAQHPKDAPAGTEASQTHLPKRKRKRRSSSHSVASSRPRMVSPNIRLAVAGLLVAVILSTLVWNYVLAPPQARHAWDVLAASLAKTPVAEWSGWLPAKGVLWLFIGTIILVVAGWSASLAEENRELGTPVAWGRALALVGGIGLGLAGLYALIHASLSVPPTNPFQLLNTYYSLIALIALALAALLMRESTQPASWATTPSAIAALVLGVPALLLAYHANITPIRADILYKQGLQFDSQKQWQEAALFYEKAVSLVPTQDYYWLFVGRARLEFAKEQPPAERDAAFAKALAHLERAHALSPFNTDHVANLARLYRTWGQYTEDPALQQERFQKALEYYAQALELTPQSAQLLDEWGLTYALMGDVDAARALYERSLALDDRFAYTYMLLGDLAHSTKNWAEMAHFFEQAVALEPTNVQAWSELAYAYAQMEELDKSIAANLRILELIPNDYITTKNLAILYNNQGNYTQALAYLERALNLAPQEDLFLLQTMQKDLLQKIGSPQGE